MSDLLDRIVELGRRIAILEAGTGTGLGGTDQTIKGCHDRLDALMGAGKSSAPMCRVRKSSANNVADSTATAIGFGSEDYDTDTMHDNSTNPSRITFTTAGKYHVGAMIKWAGAAGGTRKVSIVLGGATTLAAVEHPADCESMTISLDYVFTAAQYVELVVYQDSGGTIQVLVEDGSPTFWAHKIG